MVQQEKSTRPGLKICGVTSERDVAACLALGVDFVGFNFYPGSKRRITPERAAQVWAGALAEHARTAGPGARVVTQPVGVFVDMAPAAVVAALASFPALSCLQFHGDEEPEDLRALAPALGGRTVWKAIAVHGADDIAQAGRFGLDAAALLLFDGVAGGSGQPFDWRHLAAYRGPLAVGIAGGIKPGGGMLASLVPFHPALVDLCSGVESAPGVKDLTLVQALWREHQQTW